MKPIDCPEPDYKQSTCRDPELQSSYLTAPGMVSRALEREIERLRNG